MSFRALVVPEDPTNDRYILKPLVEAMLAAVGKPNANVDVLSSPRVTGYNAAKRYLKDRGLALYADRNVILFLPDSDLIDRQQELDDRERVAGDVGARLLCCAAVPEVEAWLLAGHLEELNIRWNDVRAHSKLKEVVFEPFLAKQGDPRRAGGGRDVLMKETLDSLSGLLARCDELRLLRDRLRLLITS